MGDCGVDDLLKFIFFPHFFQEDVLGNVLDLDDKMGYVILNILLDNYLEKFIFSPLFQFLWRMIRKATFFLRTPKFEYFLIYPIETEVALFNSNFDKIAYAIHLLCIFITLDFFIVTVLLWVNFHNFLFFHFVFHDHFRVN